MTLSVCQVLDAVSSRDAICQVLDAVSSHDAVCLSGVGRCELA